MRALINATATYLDALAGPSSDDVLNALAAVYTAMETSQAWSGGSSLRSAVMAARQIYSNRRFETDPELRDMWTEALTAVEDLIERELARLSAAAKSSAEMAHAV